MGSSLEQIAGGGFDIGYFFQYLSQPSLTQNMYAWHMIGSSTTAGTAAGYLNTSTGTIAHPTPAATNVYTQCRRTTYQSASSSNAVAGEYVSTTTQNWVWRGNAAGLGGFLYALRFTIEVNVASTRMFAGLSTVTGATTMCSGEPSAASGDFIGVGFNASNSNTNLRVMWKDGTTYGDADISSNAVRSSGNNLWDLYIYALANDTKIYVTLYDVYNSALALDEVGYSTNIPRNTVFMGPVFMCGAASSSGPTIGMCRTAIMTPY
jgi:hypothetical protein